jgi:NADH-quinone oxidoreductase subunit E
MLQGAYELLDHAEQRLGIAPGGTTADAMFTLEDAECLALCGNAPCVTVNWRYFGDMDPASFDGLVDELAAGDLDDEVPPHGVLSRVERSGGLRAAGASVHGAGGPRSVTDGAVARPVRVDEPTPPAEARTDAAAGAGPGLLVTVRTTAATVALDGGRPAAGGSEDRTEAG